MIKKQIMLIIKIQIILFIFYLDTNISALRQISREWKIIVKQFEKFASTLFSSKGLNKLLCNMKKWKKN
jgi:hypothetical protein